MESRINYRVLRPKESPRRYMGNTNPPTGAAVLSQGGSSSAPRSPAASSTTGERCFGSSYAPAEPLVKGIRRGAGVYRIADRDPILEGEVPKARTKKLYANAQESTNDDSGPRRRLLGGAPVRDRTAAGLTSERFGYQHKVKPLNPPDSWNVQKEDKVKTLHPNSYVLWGSRNPILQDDATFDVPQKSMRHYPDFDSGHSGTYDIHSGGQRRPVSAAAGSCRASHLAGSGAVVLGGAASPTRRARPSTARVGSSKGVFNYQYAGGEGCSDAAGERKNEQVAHEANIRASTSQLQENRATYNTLRDRARSSCSALTQFNYG